MRRRRQNQYSANLHATLQIDFLLPQTELEEFATFLDMRLLDLESWWMESEAIEEMAQVVEPIG